MNAQRNINALESQVIHDAQWEGDYNAKVAASQASDGTQPAGASDVADAQADATTATNAPVANADAPAQAAKTNQTPAVTPADKPATETPKTDAPAPATNTNKGNDTNIGNASDIIKGVDDGANTPATQPAQPADKPAEAQKPVVETPKTDTPATNAPTSVASSSAAPVETQSPASEAPGANDKPVYDAPMSHEVPANPVDGSTFIAMDPASTESFHGSYGPLTYHTSFSGYSVSDLTNGKYQGLWLDMNGNAHNPNNPVEDYYEKQDIDNLVPRYIDAHTPVKGTESEGSEGLVGTTYHMAFSGYSVSDLTNGKYQGLSLDKSGNAVDPDYPVRILYTKQDINNLVTRYIDELVGGASSVIKSIG